MTSVYVTPQHDTSMVSSPVVTINERSTKEQIIDSSLEIIDTQSEEIDNLRQQQKVLITGLALLLLFNALF